MMRQKLNLRGRDGGIKPDRRTKKEGARKGTLATVATLELYPQGIMVGLPLVRSWSFYNHPTYILKKLCTAQVQAFSYVALCPDLILAPILKVPGTTHSTFLSEIL